MGTEENGWIETHCFIDDGVEDWVGGLAGKCGGGEDGIHFDAKGLDILRVVGEEDEYFGECGGGGIAERTQLCSGFSVGRSIYLPAPIMTRDSAKRRLLPLESNFVLANRCSIRSGLVVPRWMLSESIKVLEGWVDLPSCDSQEPDLTNR